MTALNARIATGMAVGQAPSPELAGRAVAMAMQKAGIEMARSVLLFLSSEFAENPVPALRAASKASNCLQVNGCTATGFFTEQDWRVEAHAAAAMVFGEGIFLQPRGLTDTSVCSLVLARPAVTESDLSGYPGTLLGGVVGDLAGLASLALWQGAQPMRQSHLAWSVYGAAGAVGLSRGIQRLSEAQPVTAAHGHELIFLGGKPALETLQQACQERPLPWHRLFAGVLSGEDANAEPQLVEVIGANEENRSVTLAKMVNSSHRVFWALRDGEAAHPAFESMLNGLSSSLIKPPAFGLMFSCLSRGPYFYSGGDQDVARVRNQFPGMPMIGFYGNGQIATQNDKNTLLQAAAVLGLFHGTV